MFYSGIQKLLPDLGPEPVRFYDLKYGTHEYNHYTGFPVKIEAQILVNNQTSNLNLLHLFFCTRFFE